MSASPSPFAKNPFLDVQTIFELVSAETVPLTPELVQEFAEMPGSITEREVSEDRLETLRALFEEGLAVTFHWAKVRTRAAARGMKPGEWVRVNGQHSSRVLAAILASGGKLPKNAMVHLDSYEVDNAAGEVMLFRQFDPRISSRSRDDVTGAYAQVNKLLQGVDRKFVRAGAEGIWWYRRVYAHETDLARGDDRYEIVMDEAFAPYLAWLATKVLQFKTPEMKQQAVIAATYATFERSPTKAAEFWGKAVGNHEEVGSESTDPPVVLDNWLQDVKRGDIKGMKDKNVFQGCIYAWNNFLDGKPITKIHFDVKKGFLAVKYPAAETAEA